MILGLELLEVNLKISLEFILLLIIMIGCIIFYASDFRIGTIMTFIATGGMFMLSYQLDWNFLPAGVLTFMSVIMMAFSFYAAKASTDINSKVI